MDRRIVLVLTVSTLLRPGVGPVTAAENPKPAVVVNTAANPVPVAVTNSSSSPIPTTIEGTTNVNVINAEPLVVKSEGVLPRHHSDIIDVQATRDLGETCPGFSGSRAFDRRIVDNTVVPFSVPPDKVFVVTGFDFMGHGPAQNMVRWAMLYRLKDGGVNGPSAIATGLADAQGRFGGSLTFPTGIVVNPGVTLCWKLDTDLQGDWYIGVVHGYLTDF